jgi:hypothetical protein
MRCGRSLKRIRQFIPCWRASGAKAASNSSRPRPKPRLSISILRKKVLRGASLTYWSALRIFPLCIAMNPETAAMRPLWSGQSIRRRTL